MTEEKKENLADVLCERDVPVEMRDGTVLRCDVWRPRANERVPALLQRQPYDKRMAQSYVYAHPGWYARHGYGVVVQDTRGRGSSAGDFYPYVAMRRTVSTPSPGAPSNLGARARSQATDFRCRD